jgi:hypothetical protein
MLVLGHAGITLGAVALLSRILGTNHISKTTQKETLASFTFLLGKIETSHDSPKQKISKFTSLLSRIDLRLLLIGSLLPDIIDKPIGLYFFRETFSNGRIFCHTLLFLVLVTFIGSYFYHRREKTGGLALSFGTLTHLILDQMWYTPRTLLWPLLGNFERIDFSNWTTNIFYALFNDPAVYIPEIAGAVILFWFIWVLLDTKQTLLFFRHGQIK